MDTAIISAVIAVIGVALSSVFAYVVSTRQASHRFNELLYQARLACYPDLYAIASRLAKHLRYGTVTPVILRQEAAQLDEWDSQHALLLSPISVKALFDLRFHLRSLDADSASLTDSSVSQPLVRALADVENSIKTEIGVYSLSDYHNPEFVRDVSDYIPKTLRK